MSKKKEIKDEVSNEVNNELPPLKKRGVLGKLTHRQFAEWKFSIYEMQLAESKVHMANTEASFMQLTQENALLKSQLHTKTKVETTREKSAAAKVEYEKIKEELEKQIGYSLSGKVIDEITLEVKDLS